MKKSEFKMELFNLLKADVDGLSYDERMAFAEKLTIDFQKDLENEKNRDISNKRKPWKDEELKIILSDAPTQANALKYARLFKRGYGSVEQIYRWSGAAERGLDEARAQDKFIMQILRVAKEIGMRG